MTGIGRSSDGLDPRRRRALFRAWHRGTRENDLLLGRFADAYIGRLTDAELADFEALLEVPDRDLFAWVTGAEAAADHATPLFTALLAFHSDATRTDDQD